MRRAYVTARFERFCSWTAGNRSDFQLLDFDEDLQFAPIGNDDVEKAAKILRCGIPRANIQSRPGGGRTLVFNGTMHRSLCESPMRLYSFPSARLCKDSFSDDNVHFNRCYQIPQDAIDVEVDHSHADYIVVRIRVR